LLHDGTKHYSLYHPRWSPSSVPDERAFHGDAFATAANQGTTQAILPTPAAESQSADYGFSGPIDAVFSANYNASAVFGNIPSPPVFIEGIIAMKCSRKYCTACVALLTVCALGRVMIGRAAADEPNYQTAAGWWKEMPKKWTPVGWKNHLLRYDVLFNGAIVSKPDLNGRTKQWLDRGVFLLPSAANPTDDGAAVQGWQADHDAPVLWTQWRGSLFSDGKLSGPPVRQEVFGHIPGVEDVKTGIEPLFAWMRLSFDPLAKEAGTAAAAKRTFSYKIYAPDILVGMWGPSNMTYGWTPYSRKLTLQPAKSDGLPTLLIEPDGNVRLAVAATKGVRAALRSEGKAIVLDLALDAHQAGSVDLLLPVVPCALAVVRQEWSLGYDKALAEADLYWRRRPPTAAAIDVPEQGINDAIRSYLKTAEVVAERNPATGEYCTLTGTWVYADVWSTPNSMTFGLLLDPMGYHAAVERYLAIFKKRQGVTVPPGNAFKPHPGYLGTPKEYWAVDWLTDNGALLWAMAQHGLLSRDKKFIDEYTPTIVRSCEWIRDARRITGHGGFSGILPPGFATDERVPVQATWNDGWNYKGLATAARLLRRTGHPRAAEFEAEARQYRNRFRTVFAEASRKAPTWTDAAGKVHIVAPRSLAGNEGNDPGKQAFYLDAGPMFLVFAGLMDADDELMCASRLWFREGPGRKTYRDNGEPFQAPSLQHEMSSCEPCYSWVFFHSWQQGDRAKFLEGMYSLFAGASSRQTYTTCESRGGVTGLTPCLPNVWLARLAMIDDQIREDELHLLRLMPLAWLRADKPARFENMPTEFGVVSLTAGLSADGRELQVTFRPKFAFAPKQVVLHVPPAKGLAAIRLNGRPLAWDGKAETIVLPN
jgi:hypothetical protein